jgi:hypothetical protein
MWISDRPRTAWLKQHFVLAVLALTMCALAPADAQEQAQRQADMHAATVERLLRFGNDLAAMLAEPSALQGTQRMELPHTGEIVMSIYSRNGAELQTLSEADAPRPRPWLLTITGPGYQLPMGLQIGDARAMVERALGPATKTKDGALVYLPTSWEGSCGAPVTFTFSGTRLVQASWDWKTCID